MSRYCEIFNEIVDIVHHDYAGYEEKQGWDQPEYYREKIITLENNQEITPQKFAQIVDEYLLSFQDRHMYFYLKGSEDVKTSNRGFRVRRYGDALYVTETNEENRFLVGSKIISIDNQTIEQTKVSNQSLFERTSAEREDWTHILNKSSCIEIENETGERIEIALQDYEPVFKKRKHSLEAINKETLLITLPSFNDVEDTLAFIRNQEEKLKTCINLIIDVRHNLGGNSQSYSSLLPYIFPCGKRPSKEVKPREFNFTERNSDLFIKLCKKLRKRINDKRALDVLNFAEELCEKYRGQGFVEVDFSKLYEEEFSNFEGTDFPKNVIVLTDVNCASAAEYFVEACKESSKVTVIGRATMGVNDYSDLVINKWDKIFFLHYPISRRVQKTVIDPIHGKGIQPDQYIRWTPEHLYKDIDLLLEMFQEKVQ